MLGDDQNISSRIISAVSGGHLETSNSLTNSYRLSCSKEWSDDGYDLLIEATARNFTAITELFLKHGSKVNSKNHESTDTPLHFAALHGNVKIVKTLLNKGANINAQNEDGRTPLFDVINTVYSGSKQDKLEVIELLIKHRADVNATDNYGISPLHVAIYFIYLFNQSNTLHYITKSNSAEENKFLFADPIDRRFLKIVELLLEYGAYLNCRTFAVREVQLCIPEDYAPLHCAVEYDLEEVTAVLLSRGADIDVKTENGITPLHIAAKKGYTHIAEELLSHGACINCLTLEEGFTPLHIASERKCEEIVKLLLTRGADVNASTKNTLTPLHIATKGQSTSIVKLLLQHGAKVDNEDKDGKTILHLAVESGNLMIVEDVLKYCPDVNNPSNRSSLNTAVYGYREKKIVRALIEYGLNFNINPNDINNAKLLHDAVEKGYLKIVEDLLEYGTDVNMLYNKKYEEGFTPLHTAAKYEQHVIAKLLISYEADINAQDKSGKTPIFYAIQNADLKMTRLLLNNKANVKDYPELLNKAVKKECIEIVEALLQHIDVNASDTHGRTALYFNCFSNFPHDIKAEIAELLLSKGANVNVQTKDGKTPLFAAIYRGYAKVVEVLLKYNANFNSGVKTVLPLHFSAEIGNEEIIRMLLNKGADVNAKQSNGMTALHIAAVKYSKEVIKILLKYGADINAQDDYGRTALHIASEAGQENIVEALLQYGSDINVLSRNNHTPFDHADTGQKSKLPSQNCGLFDGDYDYDDDYYYQNCGLYDGDYDDYDDDYDDDDYDYDDDDYYYDDNDFDIVREADPYGFIRETLGRHVVKMKTANLYVNDKNIKAIKSTQKIKDYQVKCEKEIEKMKSEKIHNANISFYDILARDTSSLANYTRNENVVQILKSDDYQSKFPIYASMIKCSFRKVMKRKELLDQVNDIIYCLFKNLPQLPYDCTDKILSYLSDEDLRIIMDSSNKPLSISNPNP